MDILPLTWDDKTVVATTREGLATDITTRGFSLRADEPVSVGGTETGPTPYGYLGAALASCTSMTLRMYADRKGWPLQEITTSVDYDRVHAEDCEGCEELGDELVHRLTRRIRLSGDLDDDQRKRLLQIADRCPVHRTLEGILRIQTSVVD